LVFYIYLNTADGDYVRDRRLSVLSPMVQGYFDLLVEVLDHAKMEGNAMPKQKYIKQQLLRKNPFIFERSGLKSFEGKLLKKFFLYV